MLALAKSDLPLTAKLESHLARCLDCRACERVCPSYVSYGLALDSARNLIESQHASNGTSANRSMALIQWLVEKPARMQILGKILRLYQWTGLQWLLRKTHALQLVGLASLDAAIPKLVSPRNFAEIYSAQTKTNGQVTLFTGCQASMADRQVLTSSIRLLNRLGYEVHVPRNQGCCGALHLHDGRTAKAAEIMQRNIAAFGNGKNTIISVASGCAVTLCEYGKYLDGIKSAEKFSDRIMDINQFLAGISWPKNVSFRPLAQRIAVHDPCTLTNVLRQEDKPYALLGKIPGAEIMPLPENKVCCGAAGAYHLTQKYIAGQLRNPKIGHLKHLTPDILVTSNSGCSTFLAAGLREAGLAIETMHPVTLLERQLEK